MATKKCRKCRERKETKEFFKHNTTIDGFRSVCKVCETIKGKKRHRKWYKDARSSGFFDSLVRRYKTYHRSSREKDIGFSLTMEQFEVLTNRLCAYCNAFSPGKLFCGIDRIDSSKGYEIDNCTPCCSICNHMKFVMSVGDFLDHIARISIWQNQKDNHATSEQQCPGGGQL